MIRLRRTASAFWGPILGLLLALIVAAPAAALTPDASGATATDVSCAVAGCVGTTDIADASVTLAKEANMAAATVQGRASGAGTGVPTALTGTQIAAIVPTATASQAGVVTLATDVPAFVVLPGDVSESAGVDATATGLTFTPASSGVYLVQVFGVYTAAATTTGLQWRIDPGNGTGGVWLQARGSSGVVAAFQIAPTSTVNVLGTTTGSGETMFQGSAIITAHASPTAVSVLFLTEVGGSAVTLKGGKVVMTYRRLL